MKYIKTYLMQSENNKLYEQNKGIEIDANSMYIFFDADINNMLLLAEKFLKIYTKNYYHYKNKKNEEYGQIKRINYFLRCIKHLHQKTFIFKNGIILYSNNDYSINYNTFSYYDIEDKKDSENLNHYIHNKFKKYYIDKIIKNDVITISKKQFLSKIEFIKSTDKYNL